MWFILYHRKIGLFYLDFWAIKKNKNYWILMYNVKYIFLFINLFNKILHYKVNFKILNHLSHLKLLLNMQMKKLWKNCFHPFWFIYNLDNNLRSFSIFPKIKSFYIKTLNGLKIINLRFFNLLEFFIHKSQ